jgi:hypothetical protein
MAAVEERQREIILSNGERENLNGIGFAASAVLICELGSFESLAELPV